MNHDLRLLIAEDSPDDALLMVETLQNEGYTVEWARVESEHQLTSALEQTWDLIISDYSMPGLNAEQVLESVRAVAADIPFIVVSGTSGDPVAVEMMRRGADDYILKEHLSRLGPSVTRGLRDARNRREKMFAEHALRESERRFRSTFEQAAVGMTHLSLDGRYLRVNQRFCEIVGRPVEEIIGTSALELTIAGDREATGKRLNLLREGRIPGIRQEKRYVRKDGSEVPVEVTASPVRGNDGQTVYFTTVVQDVSQRREAERAMRDSLEFNRAILASMAAHVAVLDREGRIVTVNEAWERFAEENAASHPRTGVGSNYLQVTRSAASVDPLAGEIADGLEAVILGSSREYVVEYPCHSPEKERWFLLQARPLSIGDGGAVIAHTDITERKLAEERLAESERRYRSLFERNLAGVYLTTLDGRILDCNDAAIAMFGFRDREDMLRSSSVDAYVDPSEREQLIERLHEDKILVNVETRFRRADGRIFWALANLVLLEEASEPILQGTILDISDWKRAESERLRLAGELQLLLDSTVEGFFAVDEDGRCTLINRAGADMLGYPIEELIGKRLHDLIHHHREDGSPYPFEECSVAGAVRDRSSRRVHDEVFFRRNGETFPVIFSAAPVSLDGTDRGAVVAFSDVTRNRLLEAQLEQVNRVTSLGRVAATIAHEFNNVLMGIQPFVELLRRQSAGDSRFDKPLSCIAQSVQRGSRITQEILGFSRQAEPKLEPVDVRSWFGGVVTELASFVGNQYRIESRIELEEATIRADRDQLHQVLLNLAANARDSMPDGGEIRITATRDRAGSVYPFGVIERPERFAHISFEDSGCGMSDATLQQIFEPLFTTKRKGTGLGLAVAHQIVTRHKGQLFVESREGTGTSFHLFLPLTPEVRESSRAQPAGRLPRRVLLVEDDLAVAEGVQAVLESEQIVTCLIHRGEEAEAAMTSFRPDVVLLDIGLPDVDGIEVCRRLRHIDPDLPVVFSTGHAKRAGIAEFDHLQRTQFLMKPYEAEDLLEVLQRVHGARQAREPLTAK